jgi:hypothetical protein
MTQNTIEQSGAGSSRKRQVVYYALWVVQWLLALLFLSPVG